MPEPAPDHPAESATAGDDATTHDREVRDVPDAHRYEILVGGTVAGFAVYHRRGGRAYFVHTEIDPGFEGQGLGSALASGALDRERELAEPVVPLCPFVRSFIDRHPAYADLVDHDMLERIDGGG